MENLTTDNIYDVCKLLKPMEDRQIRYLGGVLGLDYYNLKRMKDLPSDMVAAWMRAEDNVLNKSGNPTWSTLKKALSEIGLHGIADKIHSLAQATHVPHERTLTTVTTLTTGCADKELQAENESKVKSSFSRLLKQVASKLSNKEPPVDLPKFHLYLVGLFHTDNGHGGCIPQRGSIDDMFKEITSKKLWDYMNYRPLSAIVQEYCESDVELKEAVARFETTRSNFMATKSIASYLVSYRRKGEEPAPERFFLDTEEYYSALTTRLEIRITNQTLEYVEELWCRVAKFFDLPSLFSILKFILENSILIIWRIPVESAEKIRLKIEENIEDVAHFFETECITEVLIDGVCVFKKEWSYQGMTIGGIVTQAKTTFWKWMRKDLVGACRSNDMDTVMDHLKQKGINVNIRETDKFGWAPIMWACENGNFELVEILIQHGADVNVKAKENYWTSLIIASQRGHLKIVQLLLDHNADVDAQTRDGSSALIWALYNKHEEISELLVEKGANINVVESNGWSPIIRASNQGLIDIVKLLCDNGADVNRPAEGGWTALMAATNRGHKEVVDELILRGAEPNLTMTETNETALHVACYRGHTEIAISLFKAGSDTQIRNKEGLTPEMVAKSKGHHKTLEKLIQKGMKVFMESSVDVESETPAVSISEEIKWKVKALGEELERGIYGGIEFVRNYFSFGGDKSNNQSRS